MQIKIKSKNKSKNEKNNGEILVKSKSLFKKYYNDEQSTNEKFKDGFYHTGDYGWIDNDGFLFVESRREDLIVTGGENVSAVEVELLIKLHPKVNDVIVFGIDDQIWGQKVCAAVVAKPDSSIYEEELNLFLKKSLAGYKIPKKFLFLKKLPRTELGKVMKDKLIDEMVKNRYD